MSHRRRSFRPWINQICLVVPKGVLERETSVKLFACTRQLPPKFDSVQSMLCDPTSLPRDDFALFFDSPPNSSVLTSTVLSIPSGSRRKALIPAKMGGLQKFLPPWSRRSSKTSASSTESKPAQPRSSSTSENPSNKAASSQSSVTSDKGVIVDAPASTSIFEQSLAKPDKGKAVIRDPPLADHGRITNLSPSEYHTKLASTGWPSTTVHRTLTPTSALLALQLYLHFTARHAKLVTNLTRSLFPFTYRPATTHLTTTLTNLHASTKLLHTTLTHCPIPISAPLLNLIEDALKLRLCAISADTHALICEMQISRLDRSKRRPMSDLEARMRRLADYARQGASLIGIARVRVQREMGRAPVTGPSAKGKALQRKRSHGCQTPQDRSLGRGSGQ